MEQPTNWEAIEKEAHVALGSEVPKIEVFKKWFADRFSRTSVECEGISDTLYSGWEHWEQKYRPDLQEMKELTSEFIT